MTASATGESQKHSGFKNQLAAVSPAPEIAHNKTALVSEISPAGRWRLVVRGLSASNLRSTMRLKAIAQVRAQIIARRMSPNVRQPGQPRLSRAATHIAASAKGKAKTVCEKRTKEAHFWIAENIF